MLDSFNRELAQICKIGLSGSRPQVKSKRKKLDDDKPLEIKAPDEEKTVKETDEELKEGEKKNTDKEKEAESIDKEGAG